MTPPQHPHPLREPPPRHLPWRGALLGLLLIPFNAFWVITAEAVQFGPYVTTLSLLPNVLFWLLLLNGANRLVARFRPAAAFSQGELLVTYAVLAVGSVMAGCDLLQILMHYIGHPAWVEGVQPGYTAAWRQYVPTWLTVNDPAAIKGYYGGATNLYTPHHLKAWATPVAGWMLFIALLTTGMLCLNALVYRRWADEERLPFPLVLLPIEMTAPAQRLWRQPLFWIGFAFAGSIDLWNGFAFLYPSLPAIPTNYMDISPYVTIKPWSAIGWTTISFYPIIVGIGYLLPLDLLFSCWFFYLFWKAQLIVSNAMAWDYTPKFPYTDQQGFGGLLAVGLLTLWSGREHLGQVARRAIGLPSTADDSAEAMRYRTALFGFVLCFLGLVIFSRVAGLNAGWAVFFFAVYFLVVFTITRIRAEFGAPVHDLINAAPEVALTDVLGPRAFSTADLTVMSLFYWFSKLHRSDLMPQHIEAMKMADHGRAERRAMLVAVTAAIHVGALAAFWAMIHQGYALGNAAKWSFPAYAGWETFNRLNSWIDSPKPPNVGMAVAMGAGALCCLAMFVLRRLFLGFPFHPIAYVISGTFQMNLLYLPLFLAWMLKGLILRFGGRAGYLYFLPFFFGLILGQSVVGAFWSLASVWTGERMYSFWGY